MRNHVGLLIRTILLNGIFWKLRPKRNHLKVTRSLTAGPSFSYSEDSLLPAYARVARKVQARLARMTVGDRLPPERKLCEELGVSRVTLRRAMEPFHREGFLQTRRRGGTILSRAIAPPRPGGTEAKIIGLVVPTVEISFISRIVRGAEALAAERRFHVALAHDHDDMDYQLQQLTRMAGGTVRGIAVFPDGTNLVRPEFHAVIEKIKAQEIPLVMIDRYVPNLDTPSVLSDNIAGAYSATEHLILSGHRRLALLSFGPEGGVSDRERRKGFLNALQDYGLPPSPVHEAFLGDRKHEESARKVVAEWLRDETKPRFDGIFCMQDNMAYGAFLALRDAGFSVPDDVALVGYDNLNRELYQADGLHLTSVDQPAEEIGRRSAALLINQIEGKAPAEPIKAKHILLKPRLVIRKS